MTGARLAAAAAVVLLAAGATTPGAGPARVPATSPEAAAAAERITARSLRSAIRFLAHDLLEGRGPASRGDRIARLYIASVFERLGLRPAAADGGWEQPFGIVGITGAAPRTWTFRGARGAVRLAWWDEFIASSGVQRPQARLDDAELVFVGYGITAPEHGWDDFKGADLNGKLLLVLNDDPDWDPALFAGKRRLYYGRWTYKYEAAARAGAAGAIIVHTTPSAGYPWQVVQTSWSGEQFELPATGEPRLEVTAWITEPAAARLVALAGHDLSRLIAAARGRDFRPLPLGLTTSLTVRNELRTVRTANVLGVLPGGDPGRRDEFVVYTAHHDHLGTGEPDATGDAIYNGALDNASGVAQMLAIAGAFAGLAPPPPRSVLFLAVGAEEQGLLGSRYWAAHPTVHPGRIAANINIDGGNVWGRTRDVALVGYGKSEVDAVARAVAAMQGRTLTAEAFPDRGYFYRSDQFNFAKLGVPALYLDTGTRFIGRPAGWARRRVEQWEASRYHQPGDEYDPAWDLGGMVDDARLQFLTGLALAHAARMPSWTPGDEFEAARHRALAELGD